MTIWAIIDQTNTIINVVDDQNGKQPPMIFVVGQKQIDLNTLPPGTWAGAQLLNGQWLVPQPDPAPAFLAQLASLSSAQLASVMKEVNASPLVASVSTAAVATSSAIVIASSGVIVG